MKSSSWIIIAFVVVFGRVATVGEWFEPREKVLAVALVVHGFNGKTSTMYAVKDALVQANIKTLVLTLSGHGDSDDVHQMSAENWRNDFSQAFSDVQSQALEHDVKLFIVGHSMGCLLASCHLATLRTVDNVAGCIYFAPADGLRSTIRLLLNLSSATRLLPHCLTTAAITFFADEHVARADLPVSQALQSLTELVNEASILDYAQIKTLVLLDPADPLVHRDQLERLSLDQGLHWEIYSVPSGTPAHVCTVAKHQGFATALRKMHTFIAQCGEGVSL